MSKDTPDEPYLVIVDDSEEDAELTTRVLRGGNLIREVVHFFDGVEALDFVFSASFKAPPILMLLDLDMPKIHGLEVLKKIKNDEMKKRIPVVIMSSCSDEEIIKQSYSLGVNGFVKKHTQYDLFKKEITHLGEFWLKTNYSPAHWKGPQQ
jgi:two-component system, response regulator